MAELLANCLQIPPEQRPTFLQVARGQLRVERLAAVASTPATGFVPGHRLPRSAMCLPRSPTPLIGREPELAALSRLLCDAQCQLLTLTLPEFIAPAIGSALGLVFSGSLDPEVQLLNYLRQKSLLLVLDNIEHLLEGTGLLAELLQQAPGVKLLVTSRERLNLPAEWLFDIHGLAVLPLDQMYRVEEYSAVALFVQSACQARAGGR